MITALDHLVLIAPDDAVSGFLNVLGRDLTDVFEVEDGRRMYVAGTDNIGIEIMSPFSEGPGATRLNELMTGEVRLASLAFASNDLDAAHHTATRRGLNPGDIQEGVTGNHFRCEDAACAGVKTFIVEPERSDPDPAAEPGAVIGLDHIVVNTPNPQRALAHYGARLGLRLALDRQLDELKSRLLFFKVGDITVEIMHRLDQDQYPDADDVLWGLSWRVDDLDAAHARLSDAGVEVSQTRTGRKPGTRVFTVKSHTLDVPTLFIEQSPR